ncbi:hypothetical protein NEHOM01_0943 [Nematocida homosporus]|uniref:uncharacterized protein n=1 Tax=Nematocida homosporus TaxID=1912981 RepID=UPI00221F69FD|nr:uncharacterized protein NEHOM01_0943 [Nematocida homosporus]KAI5185617.1 hypothetical protein NEHOM01_0943 [Nematocida homosporus]
MPGILECSVDFNKPISVRASHVVCRTRCGRVIRLRLFEKSVPARPDVAIKYTQCLTKRIGYKYLTATNIGYINRESRLALEQRIGTRIVPCGAITEDLKKTSYIRGILQCEMGGRRSAIIKDYDLDLPGESDPQEVLQLIINNENLFHKIAEQQKKFNRYGVETIRMLQKRFFGCYHLQKKRAGVHPFVLKGSWTREKASRFFYSYKTSLALERVALFINLFPKETEHTTKLEIKGKTVYYHVRIDRIDILDTNSTKKRLESIKDKKSVLPIESNG